MVLFLPVAICVVGLLMYALAGQEKVREIGKIMFWVGLLATLLGSGAVLGRAMTGS